MSQRFDAVVIGAGPGGEVVVDRLHTQGLSTAVVERELVGGECAYWACIPSKTLLRPGEVREEAARAAGTSTPDREWSELAEYRDYMIRNLDDRNEIESYEKRGVRVFKGVGRLVGPHEIRVGDEQLETERVVIATGSVPRIPEIAGLDKIDYWTNREATTLKEVPRSVVVLGGGPVGIELAQFLRRFGAEVTLVESADRLLSREEDRVSELIGDYLVKDGIDLQLGVGAAEVAEADGGHKTIRLESGAEVSGEQLLIAVGRAPRVDDLGLDTVGIEPAEHGIEVDERCRAADGVWAVGDVTGALPFTHVAKYQGRLVCADIAGQTVKADYRAIPRVVFADPEVAAVGLTEQQAREQGIEVATAAVTLPESIARPWTYEREPRGDLGLVVDRGRGVLVGAWAVAPLAGEWIHYAALAIKTETPLDTLRDTVAQFPTFTEGYLNALEEIG
jgi:dihydrolipoamide dehydrogenase